MWFLTVRHYFYLVFAIVKITRTFTLYKHTKIKMMNTIEFKQQETKAALSLIFKLQEKLEEAEKSSDNFSRSALKETDKLRKEQHTEWSISLAMEAQLIKDGIEKLQRDIENQTFDF